MVVSEHVQGQNVVTMVVSTGLATPADDKPAPVDAPPQLDSSPVVPAPLQVPTLERTECAPEVRPCLPSVVVLALITCFRKAE